MREFSRAFELDKQLYLSQYFKTMMNAKWDTPEQREAVHAGLSLTSQINPRFAPAYAQAAILELFAGHEDRGLALSRKAEDLEPSRAGYHLLTGEILLRLRREKDAAEIARFVAERWRGADHNEAVALWNRIPEASRPSDATVIEETEEQAKVAEGKIQSVTCNEKSNKVVTLQHGNETLTFHSKGRQLVGFSDTLWYGTDHFDLCHHVEGLHAVVRYRPPVGDEYTGDWLSIEIRQELPPAHASDVPRDSPANKEYALQRKAYIVD